MNHQSDYGYSTGAVSQRCIACGSMELNCCDGTMPSGLTPITIAERDAERRTEDRTAKYLRRIDEYLPTILGAAEKRAFLRQQAAGWELRRERFFLTGGASEPVTSAGDPPQASDFTMTLLGLSVRLEAVEG